MLAESAALDNLWSALAALAFTLNLILMAWLRKKQVADVADIKTDNRMVTQAQGDRISEKVATVKGPLEAVAQTTSAIHGQLNGEGLGGEFRAFVQQTSAWQERHAREDAERHADNLKVQEETAETTRKILDQLQKSKEDRR